MKPAVCALLCAAAWATGAAAQQTAREALAASREAARQGKPTDGADILERWLLLHKSAVTRGDAALLRLEAARDAATAGDGTRVRSLLRQVEDAADAFASAPDLLARLRREEAMAYQAIGDYPHAERAMTKSVAGRPCGDPELPDRARLLGRLRLQLEDPRDAVDAFRRGLSCMPMDAKPPRRSMSLSDLAIAEAQAGDPVAAWEALGQAMELAGEDADARRLTELARVHTLLADLRPAEAAEVAERLVGNSPETSDQAGCDAVILLAQSALARGLATEAKAAADRAIVAARAVYGEGKPETAAAVYLSGITRLQLRDFVGADKFLAAAEVIARRSLGADSGRYLRIRSQRVIVEIESDRLDEAEEHIREIIAKIPRQGSASASLYGSAYDLLGGVKERLGDAAGATAAFAEAAAGMSQDARPIPNQLGFALVHWARNLARQRRYAEATRVLDRAIALHRQSGGGNSIWLAEALDGKADAKLQDGDRSAALALSRQVYRILTDRIAEAGSAEQGAGQERYSARQLFAAHALRLAGTFGEDEDALDEAFRASQDAFVSRAGDALRAAAVRLAARDDDAGRLLRAREDAADALRQADALLETGLFASGSSPDRARLWTERVERVAHLQKYDQEIASLFPRYDRLIRPRPEKLEPVRNALRSDEALLMPVMAQEETLLWVITDRGTNAIRVPVGERAIAALVRRVRAGLDLGTVPEGGQLPPFDFDAARTLYGTIVTPAVGVIGARKRLIFVSDGSLLTVPLQVLTGPEGEWLLRHYAVEVLPSVSALVSLRSGGARSGAPRDFLGIGDPRVQDFGPTDGGSRRGPSELRQALMSLAPLPETSIELSRMAALFPTQGSELLLGDDATMEALARARPGDFRTLAFATHALMAGELPGLAEPAIIMTPVGESSESGLLTASMVAALDLDANLVILSACNTAAPDGGPLADGFSGLARAFLHAGARALLVSNWAVESQATVRLTTKFLAAVEADPSAGKPEALRTAMLAMLDGPDPALRHPARWAPFVLVGE